MADLRAESDDLDVLVADLPADRWADATPAPGWTIAHQIAHLLWTDRVALTAVTDEAGFAAVLAEAAKDPTGFVDAGAEELAVLPPERLLTDWRETRVKLHDELLAVADGRKLPWFGPPMSAASMATARLMETSAHGLDVADALGVKSPRRRGCARSRTSACAPATSRSPSMDSLSPRTRSGWSCVRPTAQLGRGAPTTPRSVSMERRRTSACWSRSDGRIRLWTCMPRVKMPNAG